VPIRELSVSRLRAWQAQRVAAGVSAGTLKKARTFLSSVLRHAAESEAIPGNPLALVRAPRAAHTDAVVALAPATVEAIRCALAGATKVQVPAGTRSGRPRRAYEREGRRVPGERMRDAAIVSVLAYAGLRPGEVRALRWDDVRDKTLLVQRSAGADGAAKSTKTRAHRPVRLLAPLAADLKAWRHGLRPSGWSHARLPAARWQGVDEGGLGQLARAPVGRGVLGGRAGHGPAAI
jgi:integrase